MSDTTLPVQVAYGAPSIPTLDERRCRIVLPTDAERPAARLSAALARPAVARDALLALGDVLSSDLRRRARDRADYLAYLLSKGKGVSQAVWDAQREFLALKYGEAARSEMPLDPVVTVAPEGLRVEVFSRDESAYAQLLLRDGEALTVRDRAPGTTHLDLAAALRPLGRLRAHRDTELTLAPDGSGAAPQALHVPLRWARAFGQMQAASMLPRTSFPLAPVDLYNVLFTLRMHKAKKPPRALRYELVPGEVPRIVLEPWDLVLRGGGGPYRGARPFIARTWGRNRLLTLARLLPHARGVTVHLVGPGLPAFYVVDLGDATFTLALSGWTDAGWAGVATFDLLDPGRADAVLAEKITTALAAGPRSLEALQTATSSTEANLRPALLAALITGTIGHDVAAGLFFARPLFSKPLPLDALRYRDAREAEAHRLLATPDQVRIDRVHDLGGEGQSVDGEVNDRKAKRAFRPSFTLDREGRTTAATCTCATFLRAGIKEGPCEHMIALRLAWVRAQAALEAARDTEEGRRLIRAETRILLRRTEREAETYRVSLDDRRVLVRFGPPGAADRERVQQLLFPDAGAARDAYFARLAELARAGFIDASAAG